MAEIQFGNTMSDIDSFYFIECWLNAVLLIGTFGDEKKTHHQTNFNSFVRMHGGLGSAEVTTAKYSWIHSGATRKKHDQTGIPVKTVLSFLQNFIRCGALFTIRALLVSHHDSPFSMSVVFLFIAFRIVSDLVFNVHVLCVCERSNLVCQ